MQVPVMDSQPSLIAELEGAIQSGSKDKRVDALRRITDLFLVDADRLNDQQIGVFDDVLGRLIKQIEGKALAELSQRLGPVKNAPKEVIRNLAGHDDIAVAEPVLSRSARLTSKDLVEIASSKSQAHLLAISGREQLDTSVTDALLDRADRHVMRRLAGNTGAQFSDNGFATLVKHSENDEQLAEKVGLRLDLPLQLFRQLLSHATEAVRSRLLALAGPENREQIQRILAETSEDIGSEASIQLRHHYEQAMNRLLWMHGSGELTEAMVFKFANDDQHVEVIVALSLLCSAPSELIAKLLRSPNAEALLVLCKAAGLEWPTVRMIARCRSIGSAISDQTLDSARADYSKLTRNNAQRVLRFWQVRQSAASNDTSKAAGPPSDGVRLSGKTQG